MTPTVMKSPITIVTTKIEPMTMPGLASGITMFQMICQPVAPASKAASTRRLSMRTIELKIGMTI